MINNQHNTTQHRDRNKDQNKPREMKKIDLILVPIPVIGHFVSTVEFAKRLINNDDRIQVTILSMNWFPDPSLDAYTKSLTASNPTGIKLVDLPQVDPPSIDPSSSDESFIDAFVESYIPPVKDAVSDIVLMNSSSGETLVTGLVLDMFCSPMAGIATDLDIPSYIYLTTNAAFLGLMFYLPNRHSLNSYEIEESDPDHLIQGFVNPVPTRVLPSAVFNKDGGYSAYVKVAEGFKNVKGIIVNTFEELEPYAVNCFFNGQNGQNPPVYPVGPVIDLNGLGYSDSDDEVMKWLDDQPESSVLFLCFGSFGSFKAPQVQEIALGLEQSGVRFLWSLRAPPPQEDAFEMLPEGYLERVQGKGMIRGWVPQLKVLSHKSIGGFVSHCGWNSITESLWFGVPIVTWPLYAEQQLNAFQMVNELGLAVNLRLDYRRDSDEVVTADEIEKAVGIVMDGESEVRKKVKEMADMARKSVVEGGSSFNSIGKLIEDILGNN